jgi:hypothetical protein
MMFYSNPFLEGDDIYTGNYLKWDLDCEVFEFYDSELKEEQFVIHYYMAAGKPVVNEVKIVEL